MSLATFISYWTGLAFVAPGLDLPTLLGTALVLQLCNAVMCWLLASNRGYPKVPWIVLGLIGGLWAFAVLILLPQRPVPPADVAR